jgi:hypothetical protein
MLSYFRVEKSNLIQQFFDCPNSVCESGVLRGRLFVCGMNTAKVEMSDEQGNRVFEVSQLL